MSTNAPPTVLTQGAAPKYLTEAAGEHFAVKPLSLGHVVQDPTPLQVGIGGALQLQRDHQLTAVRVDAEQEGREQVMDVGASRMPLVTS